MSDEAVGEARRDDCAALARLATAAGYEAWDDRSLSAASEHPDRELWIAERAGEPVGLILFQSVTEEAELLLIVVKAECRGQGVGTALWERASAALGARGVRVVHLEVSAENLGAVRFYGRLGFERVGRRRGYYRDGSDALLMSGSVAPPASE